MEQTWPNFCCEGFDFIALECDSSGYGYGICLNPNCPHGDTEQGFQLDWDQDPGEDEFVDGLVHQAIMQQQRSKGECSKEASE